MPSPHHLPRRRFCLAGLLLVAAALAGWTVLRSWEERSPERVAYERIKVGMTEEEVVAITSGWGRHGNQGYMCLWISDSPHDPEIFVFLESGKVTDKHFHEGDQSFKARARRLVERVRRW
jgi:hypothetical protein